MHRCWVGKVVFCMAFILMAWGANAQEGGKIVKVDSVRIEPLSQTVPVVGRLVARQSGVVASRSSGPVAALTVQVADRVEKGQELAVLVSDSLRWQNALAVADVSAAQAALKEARAQLAILNQEMERLERLRKSAAFSQARYEDKRQGVLKAQGQLAQAQASLSRAEANRELTKIKLADASITAPYAGVVTQTHTQAGAFLDTACLWSRWLMIKIWKSKPMFPHCGLPGYSPEPWSKRLLMAISLLRRRCGHWCRKKTP